MFDAFRIDRQDRSIEGYSLECLAHLRRHMPLRDAAAEQGLDEALLCFSRLEAGRVRSMHRPILEAMGFKPICSTWPMRYRFAAVSP